MAFPPDSFMENYFYGRVTFDDITTYIEKWEALPPENKPLIHDFLGLTEAEYLKWKRKTANNSIFEQLSKFD